jgi:putative flippase GtrA
MSGALAFVTDLGMLEILIRVAHLDPLLARVGSIATAMIVGWLAQRSLTFAVVEAPTLKEFVRYATVALVNSGINYSVFAATLLIRPQTIPAAALVVSSTVAMVSAYLSMRYFVFRR